MVQKNEQILHTSTASLMLARLRDSAKPFSEKYIVFAPFATQNNRTWSIDKWKILAGKLSEAGYKVIALDSNYQKERCKPIGVEYFWGQSAKWTATTCYHAELVIGNDSGIAHLAGWLGAKALVIMSQLAPEQFYAMTNNHFVIPDYKCTGCKFSSDLGYLSECNSNCIALQSISPELVYEKAMSIIHSIH